MFSGSGSFAISRDRAPEGHRTGQPQSRCQMWRKQRQVELKAEFGKPQSRVTMEWIAHIEIERSSQKESPWAAGQATSPIGPAHWAGHIEPNPEPVESNRSLRERDKRNPSGLAGWPADQHNGTSQMGSALWDWPKGTGPPQWVRPNGTGPPQWDRPNGTGPAQWVWHIRPSQMPPAQRD